MLFGFPPESAFGFAGILTHRPDTEGAAERALVMGACRSARNYGVVLRSARIDFGTIVQEQRQLSAYGCPSTTREST